MNLKLVGPKYSYVKKNWNFNFCFFKHQILTIGTSDFTIRNVMKNNLHDTAQATLEKSMITGPCVLNHLLEIDFAGSFKF